MAFVYLLLCLLAAAATLWEQRHRNRSAHVQALLTTLLALVTGGVVALLGSLADSAGPRYEGVSAVALLSVVGAGMFAVTRVAQRFTAVRQRAGSR